MIDYNLVIENIKNFPRIGEGGHREVYDIGEGYVMKVAISYNVEIEKSIEANRNECALYLNFGEDKGYLCPVVWISDDGIYLVMYNADYLPKSKTSLSQKEFISKMQKKTKIYREDLLFCGNWVNNYLVDYGWSN